jgi:hypothetical protein
LKTEPRVKQPMIRSGGEITIIVASLLLVLNLQTFAGSAADFADAARVGTPANTNVVETSGIGASRINDGVYYIHNDSGESVPRVFALTRTGKDLGEYTFPGVGKPKDWEDLCVGSGPDPDKSYIYVAEFGDNRKQKNPYTIYMAEEPAVSLTQSPESRVLPGSTVQYKYQYDSDGTSKNAECLMIDPLTKDLYIVTKSPKREVYRYKYSDRIPDTVVTLEYITQIPELPEETKNITGGDMTATEMVIRNGERVYYWEKGSRTWDAVFTTAGDPIGPLEDTRGEAICFDNNGEDLYSLAEGVGKAINWYERITVSSMPE